MMTYWQSLWLRQSIRFNRIQGKTKPNSGVNHFKLQEHLKTLQRPLESEIPSA